MVFASYPRRHQARRLRHAAASGTAAILALGLAVPAALAGLLVIAAALVLMGGALGFSARHWARLAGRARVGARSESEVQRALNALEAEGWRLRHSLPWHGRGDIDHVAIAPTGIAFAIETKTRSYNADHLASVRSQAVWLQRRRRRWCSQTAWLQRRRRRWCPRGARPVLCVTRGPQIEQLHDEVLVVSVNQLVATLRAAAGTTTRPAFLSPTASS